MKIQAVVLAKIRKYKREIVSLAKENSNLEKKLDDAKPGIKEQMEDVQLQQEIQFLRQFYDEMPEEYKAPYQARQLGHSHNEDR